MNSRQPNFLRIMRILATILFIGNWDVSSMYIGKSRNSPDNRLISGM